MTQPDTYYHAVTPPPPPPPHPPLEGDVRCDVAVVGGGLAGVGCALELAEAGYDVRLIEARRIGWGASGRNGGQVCTGYAPGMRWVIDTYGPARARALFDLDRLARDILETRIARHAIACDFKTGYAIAAGHARHWQELADEARALETLGYTEIEILDRREMAAHVVSDAYIGGTYDRGAGQLNPLAYLYGLARAAQVAGATVHEGTTVTDVIGGAAPAVATDRGTVRADYVVLCGNAYLSGVVPAREARVMPVTSYMLATEPLAEDVWRALLPSDAAVADTEVALNYYRLSPDKRLLFGGGARYSARDPLDLSRYLTRRMRGIFPALKDVRVAHSWGGAVGVTRTRMPDIGRTDRNVFHAQGFSGQGVGLTGVAGRLIAEAVRGQAERLDVMAALDAKPFPGGRRWRTPLLVLTMAWLRLRDRL